MRRGKSFGWRSVEMVRHHPCRMAFAPPRQGVRIDFDLTGWGSSQGKLHSRLLRHARQSWHQVPSEDHQATRQFRFGHGRGIMPVFTS